MGGTSHTAENMFDDIERVIKSHNIEKVIAGYVSDNTSANKKLWKLLKDKHKNVFVYGCISHALHLLIKDILCCSKSKSNDPNPVVGANVAM